MNGTKTMFTTRRLLSLSLPLLAFGCSIIAASEPDQCATDNDCYVKFAGAYTCQAGACVASSAQTLDRTAKTIEQCRSTQECVAVRGEGWLCRRDRDDPQKPGACQQLTPTSQCTILGDYKNDRVVMLGAITPGADSPGLGTRVRAGLTQAVAEWEQVSRDLAAVPSGPDYVAPPRPFAVLACSEDMPQVELQNAFLNAGVVAIVGPTSLRGSGTDALATALTNAKILLVSPTAFAPPREGSNIGKFFYRVGGDEVALGSAIIAALGPAEPRRFIRRAGSFEALATQLKGQNFDEVVYDQPESFNGTITTPTVILGDGDAAKLLVKVHTTAPVGGTVPVYVLPTAVPDLALARARAGQVPSQTKSFRATRSTSIPATPFDARTFGDAEAFDALYTLLTALAAIPLATSVEDVKEDVLQAAYARVTTVGAAKRVNAAPGQLKQLLVDLRADVEAKLALTGASGSLEMLDGHTNRAWTECAVSSNGCQ